MKSHLLQHTLYDVALPDLFPLSVATVTLTVVTPVIILWHLPWKPEYFNQKRHPLLGYGYSDRTMKHKMSCQHSKFIHATIEELPEAVFSVWYTLTIAWLHNITAAWKGVFCWVCTDGSWGSYITGSHYHTTGEDTVDWGDLVHAVVN